MGRGVGAGDGIGDPAGMAHRLDGLETCRFPALFAVNRVEILHRLVERVAFKAGYWPSLRGDVPFDLGLPAVD